MIEQITDLQFKRVCMFINEHRDLMYRPASYRYCFCPDGFQAAHERT
jgi:hypothetical protein